MRPRSFSFVHRKSNSSDHDERRFGDTGSPKADLEERITLRPLLRKTRLLLESLAAALYLDLGLYVRNAFDVTSGGDKRGSMALYKSVLVRLGR